jgi:hypothetical protein
MFALIEALLTDSAFERTINPASRTSSVYAFISLHASLTSAVPTAYLPALNLLSGRVLDLSFPSISILADKSPDDSTMQSWSTEAILAFVTLLVTCVPIAVYLWRKYRLRRPAPLLVYGMNLLPKVSRFQ